MHTSASAVTCAMEPDAQAILCSSSAAVVSVLCSQARARAHTVQAFSQLLTVGLRGVLRVVVLV